MKTNKMLVAALLMGAGVLTFTACSSSDDDNSLPSVVSTTQMKLVRLTVWLTGR